VEGRRFACRTHLKLNDEAILTGSQSAIRLLQLPIRPRLSRCQYSLSLLKLLTPRRLIVSRSSLATLRQALATGRRHPRKAELCQWAFLAAADDGRASTRDRPSGSFWRLLQGLHLEYADRGCGHRGPSAADGDSGRSTCRNHLTPDTKTIGGGLRLHRWSFRDSSLSLPFLGKNRSASGLMATTSLTAEAPHFPRAPQGLCPMNA